MADIGQLDDRNAAAEANGSAGTRFLIYPQTPVTPDYVKPEPVWISTPPERMRAGPSDHRIYVRDPLFEKEPYEYPFMPPFDGDLHEPCLPGADGHFDWMPANSRQFLAAHAFACVARVLDIWESYLGGPIPWHFSDMYERLEIIPNVDWDNAQSGYGYLELGQDRSSGGRHLPFALNFDVIAHEVGHGILFSLCGFPDRGQFVGDFTPFHEGCSDLISLLSFMHFDSGLERLLRHCNGNLLVLNELNRIAELASDRQIRLACNQRKMSEVSNEVHDRSRPFTGAVFDTIVDCYHGKLVRQGLADERLLAIDIRELDKSALGRISSVTTDAFRTRPFQFKAALADARDEVAMALLRAWSALDANELSFDVASEALLRSGSQINSFLGAKLEENLAWRELI
jgi:hypothetical protein